MTMRAFSDDFLDRYLETAGHAVTTSVGAYQVEPRDPLFSGSKEAISPFWVCLYCRCSTSYAERASVG